MLGRVGGDFGRMGLVRPAGHLAGASLDLNFVASSGYPAAPSLLLTTTRASTAYADNSAGVWSSFAANIPRITDKGLLVEESRTNSIRNNSMQGAVAGTPGTPPTNWTPAATGVTIQLVGTGTENGVDYIDYRFSGTTGAVFGQITLDTTTAIAAVNGQTWTGSVFLKLVAGSWANVTGTALSMSQRDGGGAALSSVVLVSSFSPSTTLTRVSGAGATNNASTAFLTPLIGWTWASGVAIDFTIRIGWPQLELGAFATSPIRTTSAAATRAADAISITTPTGLLSAPCTLFVEATLPIITTVSGATQTLMWMSDGSTQNAIGFAYYVSTGDLRARVFTTGVSQASIDAGDLTAGVRFKTASAVATDDGAASLNGAAPATDASITIPTVNRISIGSQYGTANTFANGYIRRVAYFPTRLTNAQLQAITAP